MAGQGNLPCRRPVASAKPTGRLVHSAALSTIMSLEHWISEYGYAAIAIGTFLEGDTILILGGFAAHRGYLELPWVLLCAFGGSLLGDQLYFYLGKAKGRSIILQRPGWRLQSEKVFPLLEKHQTLLITGFRFLYGLRTVTPFLLGASGIAPLRFLALNMVGAAIWAATIGILGYLFGHTLELIMGDIRHYELWIFSALAVAGLILWCIHLLLGKTSDI